MEYKIIDCDQHVIEPPDLWQSRAPSKWKEKAPRVAHTEHGVHEDFGDVTDLRALFTLGDPVRHHAQAEGTARDDRLGARLYELLYAVAANAGLWFVVKPHATTACTAARGLTLLPSRLS